MSKKLLITWGVIAPYVAYKLGSASFINKIYNKLEQSDIIQFKLGLKNMRDIYFVTEDVIESVKQSGAHIVIKGEDK